MTQYSRNTAGIPKGWNQDTLIGNEGAERTFIPVQERWTQIAG